jgi:hypothetical protein
MHHHRRSVRIVRQANLANWIAPALPVAPMVKQEGAMASKAVKKLSSEGRERAVR